MIMTMIMILLLLLIIIIIIIIIIIKMNNDNKKVAPMAGGSRAAPWTSLGAVGPAAKQPY